MRRPSSRGTIMLAVGTGLLAAAGCGSTSSSASSSAPVQAQGPPCDTTGAAATATTASFKMVLDTGPVEEMYMQSDAAARHPATGEIMLAGTMSDARGANARNLKVHICRLSDGAVVTGAKPTIMLTDTTSGQPAQTLPIAIMQGVNGGINDLHYGNFWVIAPGHAYTMMVVLDRENATLNFTAS